MSSTPIRNGFRGVLAGVGSAAVALSAAEPARAAAEPLFGFGDSSALYRYSGSPTAKRLAGLQARAGADVARFTIHWGVVQPGRPPTVGPPRYRWGRYDRFVGALRGRGIKPLPVLLGAPEWARADRRRCGRQICPPQRKRLADWRGFVSAAVARYRSAPAVEIWNEPNLRYFWALPGGPDPGRYARLYKAGRLAARRVDPEIAVLTAGLSPVVESGTRQIEVGTFIRRLARVRGALGAASGLGLHLYPGGAEMQGLRAEGRFMRALEAARRARDDVAPGSSIWVTEFGASTTAQRGVGRLRAEASQATLISEMLALLQEDDAIAAAIAYTVVDRPRGRPEIEEGYGLLKRGPGFGPKPAYCELAAERGMSSPPRCP